MSCRLEDRSFGLSIGHLYVPRMADAATQRLLHEIDSNGEIPQYRKEICDDLNDITHSMCLYTFFLVCNKRKHIVSVASVVLCVSVLGELEIIKVYMHSGTRIPRAGDISRYAQCHYYWTSSCASQDRYKVQISKKEKGFEKKHESQENEDVHKRGNVYLHFEVDHEREEIVCGSHKQFTTPIAAAQRGTTRRGTVYSRTPPLAFFRDFCSGKST